jgi:hypothetical protein
MGLRWQNSATNLAALQQVTNKSANGNILKDKGHKKAPHYARLYV